MQQDQPTITIKATINAPAEKVWKYFTEPDYIVKWNFASDEWHAPKAENDLKVGGKFNYRMEAKNGSAGFDFEGIYDNIQTNKEIDYTIADGRKVSVRFSANGDNTTISTNLETDNTNPVELQQQGWQAILNNFKNYVENN